MRTLRAPSGFTILSRFRHSLAARLTAAFTLVILLLTVVSVTLAAMSLRAPLQAELASRLEQDQSAWRTLLEQEARVLSALARGAATSPVLRAALSSEAVDTRALQALAAEHRGLLAVDLLLITGLDGKSLAGTHSGPVPGLSALVGSPAPALVSVDGQPYQAVASPVEAPGRVVGYVVVAQPLGPVLRRLEESRQVEPLLRSGSRLVAHGVRSVPPEALLAEAGAWGAGVADVEVEGVQLKVVRQELAAGLELVLARSMEAEFARFRSTLLLLIALGTVTALAAGVGTFLLVRRMTAPLRQLTAATARVVAEGDFSGTLEVSSKDEIGQLGASFAEMMSQLRSLLLALRGSAAQLESAADQLTDSAVLQNEAVSQQAIALHETQLAAQQLQEASRAAAQRVETIQREAERAGGLGQAGEAALAGSVGGLTHVRSYVEQMGRTISELHQRTLQVGEITGTVRDLADQSNVLALNASIEAARSGDQGRAFSVVARQMRSLADQSAGATNRVQVILGDIGKAISNAVHTSEGRAREVEDGLAQVHAAGESLRSLAAIIQHNGQAVHSIAEAVSQQDAGIAELFVALSSMATSADQVVEKMVDSERAALQLSTASHELTSLVSRYRV